MSINVDIHINIMGTKYSVLEKTGDEPQTGECLCKLCHHKPQMFITAKNIQGMVTHIFCEDCYSEYLVMCGRSF
jgi:hypothetical protein